MGKKHFRFDVVIGNPPYQEEVEGNGRMSPIYNYFMDQTYEVSDKVMLITPARFLFDAGQTPRAWNKKMLTDEHLKVVYYNQDSSKVFANTDIKGGVAVTYHDQTRKMEPINHFIPIHELHDIDRKVNAKPETSLSSIIVGAVPYRFTDSLKQERPELLDDIGKSFDLRSNILDKMEGLVFYATKPNDGAEYAQIFGLVGKKRVYRWIKRDYIDVPSNFDKYKVLVPESNGRGSMEDVFSTPLVVEPFVGHTQTFISIGGFHDKLEAEALLKYIKTKFARALLSIMKATQHNPVSVWTHIPLQDFSSRSDVNWQQDIANIGFQLYEKYGLNQTEIDFIESHVKEMA